MFKSLKQFIKQKIPLLVLASAVLFAPAAAMAIYDAQGQRPHAPSGSAEWTATKNALRGLRLPTGSLGYVYDQVINPNPAEFSVTFSAGAAKGMSLLQSDGTAYDGTASVLNVLNYDGRNFAVTLGVNSTIIPAMEANGLDLTSDASAAANDTIELSAGILPGFTGAPFKIGGPAFYTCADLKIADVSGSDGVLFGFHKQQASPATSYATYTDFAVIGNISGDIKTVTDNDDGGETTTDTVANWADGEEKWVCVYVSSAGAASYTANASTLISGGSVGAAITLTTVAFSFDDGDLVVPFFWVLQDTDVSEDTHVHKWVAAYGS